MTSERAKGLSFALRFFPRAAAVAVVSLAFAVLLGWILDIAILKSLLPGLVLGTLVFAAVIWLNARSLSRTDSQRKQTESALRSSEEMLRNLFEFAPDAILISDRDGLIVRANARAEEMLGYNRDELIGKPVEILTPEALREAHVHHRAAYYSDPRTRTMGAGFGYDLSARRKDGSTFPVDIGLSPLQIDGRFFVTAIIRDITERKQAEDALRASYQELQTLNEVSREVLNSLDLQAILDGMLGAINPQQEAALQKVLNQTADQLNMINDIMQTTQLEVDSVIVDRYPVNLFEFLDHLKSDYDFTFDKEGVTLIWDYPSEPVSLVTDSGKLRQILRNLINNAIKFTDKGAVTIAARVTEGKSGEDQEGRRIDVTSETFASCLLPPASGRWVEVAVRDTGVGIPAGKLEHIFDKFYQVDSSETRLYGGVGLGLFIVKHFTALLGGQIQVQSEPGKGSTFTVTIPVDLG